MGINIHNVKRWLKMITGQSLEHVKQGIGKIYSISEIKGYYNDLTEKVTKDKNYDKIQLPILKTGTGETVLFPTAIFQYGLGAYDLYLLTNKNTFLNIFKLCVDWAYQNQTKNGSWDNFSFKQPEAPYSAMTQGEGASLLIRAYKEFNKEKYFIAAKKAIEFLVTPIENGGTAKYRGNDIFLLEFTNKPVVLNGWIFSLFGLYDYLLVDKDKDIMEVYKGSVQTLVNHLEHFDNGFWSKYDIENLIASPCYHNGHIAQLHVMYQLTNEEIFMYYKDKWNKYRCKFPNRSRALLLKAYQKITEK